MKAPESCRLPGRGDPGDGCCAAVGEKIDTFAGQVFASLPRSDQRAAGGLYLRG